MKVSIMTKRHQSITLQTMDLFSLILALFGVTFGCELTPGNSSSSCLELQATPYVRAAESAFGPNIEGASVNKVGDIFATSYDGSTLNKLGQITPNQALFYADFQTNSYFNGIRFLDSKRAYTADVANHRVLELLVHSNNEGSTVTASSVFCSDPRMLQPNDLTLSKSGMVFTSGMNWVADTNDKDGDIWSCSQDGRVQQLEVMGRTNGIDLSPDEKTLYVSESYNRGGSPYVQKIWKYDANVTAGTISGKTLFADFAEVDGSITVDVDGMKTDVNGNLYVTRHQGRQIVVFNPEGEVIGKIGLNFPNPTNLEFGGPSGTDLYIVGKCDGADRGCVDKIEVSIPGRSWTNLQLTYDFEERLVGTTPSLPIISSTVTISGLSLDTRNQLVLAFPQVLHDPEDENLFQLFDENSSKGSYARVMKSVTKLLSFLTNQQFKIVSSAVESSAFSGYVTKTYCWTLQKPYTSN